MDGGITLCMQRLKDGDIMKYISKEKLKKREIPPNLFVTLTAQNRENCLLANTQFDNRPTIQLDLSHNQTI